MPTDADRQMTPESSSPTAKVFAFLELLSRQGSARLTDLAAELGVAKSTLHRITVQLEQLGYIQREPEGRQFTVAPRLAKLSADLLAAAFRLAPRHAILERLSAQLGESCSIGIRSGNEIFYLDDVTAPLPLSFSFSTGQRAPLYCTSTGKLFLATLSDTDLEQYFRSVPLIAHTATTITDPENLRHEFTSIRTEEFARSQGEFVVGVVGLAVPIVDNYGRILAALTVSIPAARMNYDDLPTLKPALSDAARELSQTFVQLPEFGSQKSGT